MEKNYFSSSVICLLILVTLHTISAKACEGSKRCTKEAIETHCKTSISTLATSHHLHGIAKISINVAIERAEKVHDFLFSLYRSNISTPSYMRERYFSCFKNYVVAKNSLARAKRYFLCGEYKSVGHELTDAMDQGRACESVYSDRRFKGVSKFLKMNMAFEQSCSLSNAASSCLIAQSQIS